MTVKHLCPACGQPLPNASWADLERVLRDNPSRDIYETIHGAYAISFGGGYVPKGLVMEAVRDGRLVQRWPDSPHILAWKLP